MKFDAVELVMWWRRQDIYLQAWIVTDALVVGIFCLAVLIVQVMK